jgi:site-specific DNA recombinase
MEHCATHRYRVNQQHIYKDVWTGTEYMERPELSKLREDARDSLFDIVVIYAFDRLARKQVHQAVIIEDLRQQNVSIESVTEDYDESAVGQFMRNAAAFAAELEHEKIRERTQRGIMAKLKKGNLLGTGKPNYGYSWNEDKTGYVINEEEAKTVKLIFDLYVNHGYSAFRIAQYLREQGIPNPVRELKDGTRLEWGKTTVHRILTNPLYIGKGTTRKRITKKVGKVVKVLGIRPDSEQIEIAPGVIPPIIDEETFTRAQEKRAVNKKLATRHNANPEASLLRGGYAICGICGQVLLAISMSPDPQHGMNHPRYLYQCYDPDSRKRCNKINITCHILDDAAWEYVQTLIEDQRKVEERLQEIEAQLTQRTVDLGPIDTKLAEIELDMQNCAKGIIKAKDEYTIELLTTQNANLAAARAELLKTRAEIAEKANNVELIRAKLDRFRKKWFSKAASLNDNPTYQEKREACEILGIQAIVYPVPSNKEVRRWKFRIVPPEIVSLNS